MEETKKPAIRLAEFTDAWECCPLSDYLDVSNEKNNELLFSKDDVLSVSGDCGIVNQIAFKGRSFAGESVENYGVVHTGDVVYTKSPLKANPYGIIKANKGTAGIVSTLYAIYHPKENVDSSFVQTYFEQHARMNSYMNPLVNKGAKNDMKVSAENALKGLVVFPEIEEQKRIVHQFECLDDCISLAQQKYDKLLVFKKSMLEKMFPQSGAKVPEVRFAGFAGEWVEYRFGDIVSKYSDPVATPTNGYTRLGIRSHGKGTFHSEVLPGMELETAQMHRVAANNFIVNITFGWEHAVAITEEADAGKLVSHRFPQYSFHDGMIPKFFKYLILDEKFRQHLELASPGGAGRNRVLKLDDMLEYKFMIPAAPEQETVANYLIKVDKLIQLKQSELEKLKNIKSALLEKMFV